LVFRREIEAYTVFNNGLQSFPHLLLFHLPHHACDTPPPPLLGHRDHRDFNLILVLITVRNLENLGNIERSKMVIFITIINDMLQVRDINNNTNSRTL